MHVIVTKCNKDNQKRKLLKCQLLATTALFRTTVTWKSIFHQLMIGLRFIQTIILNTNANIFGVKGIPFLY